MDSVYTFLVIGIVKGSIFSLVALGMVLIIKATKVINFAQGDLVMVGAFIIYAFMGSWGLPLWFSIPLTLISSGVIGYLIYHMILKRIAHGPLISIIMVTLGLSYFLKGAVTMFFGSKNYSLPKIFPDGSILLAGIQIPLMYVYALIISFALMAGFAAFFQYSRMGLAMRATADNPKAAQSLGIRTNEVAAYSWVISLIVAAVGGLLLASINVLNTGLAIIGLTVFPVLILGGLESLAGAVVGGLIIGLAESLAAGYINPKIGAATEQVVAFLVLLLFLMVRPYGIFGRREVERL
jgi:branched-chain amino acid transport system permease protein